MNNFNILAHGKMTDITIIEALYIKKYTPFLSKQTHQHERSFLLHLF